MKNLTYTLKLKNPEVLDHLVQIVEALQELEEDMPWREDVKDALKSAEYLAYNMQVCFTKED